MYCIDTNIAVEFLRGNKILIDKIGEFESVGENIFINSVVLCELYKGVFLSSRKDTQLSAMEQFIDSLGFLDFTKEASKAFGELYADLQNEGTMTQENDLMIASIVKAHGATLVTRNKKHFANIKGLKVEEW